MDGQECKPIYEPVGEFWLCAGKCGQWMKGMAAAHNGSGYVCSECERSNRQDATPDTVIEARK